jgi:hypothetical protein
VSRFRVMVNIFVDEPSPARTRCRGAPQARFIYLRMMLLMILTPYTITGL